MPYIRKIMKSGFIRTLNISLLFSVLIQSLFISEPDDPLVLCIESNGHIAIEHPDECSLNKNDTKQKKTGHKKLTFEESYNNNDISCIDISLSFIDVLEILTISKNVRDSKYLISYSTIFTKNIIKPYRKFSSLKRTIFKKLFEYSTVSLLL
jgi:hypothetical protein